MNTKVFSEAMGEIDSRYIDQALNYRRKRRMHLFPFAAGLAIFLLTCGFAYTVYVYWGVGLAGNVDRNKLTQPFGTVAGGQLADGSDSGIFFEKSGLIRDYSDVYADCSTCVAVNENTIPPLYFSPNYMVIFTQEDKNGWTVGAGGELTFHISLYHGQSLELEVGYVLNGEYHLLSVTKGSDFNETLTGTDTGEYYFCVTNHSSVNAVIEDGEIR